MEADFKVFIKERQRKTRSGGESLLSNPSIVLCLFRALPPLMRQVVLRLLHMDELSYKVYAFWLRSFSKEALGRETSLRDIELSLAPLTDFGIVTVRQDHESRYVVLDPEFRKTYTTILVDGLQLPFRATGVVSVTEDFQKKMRTEAIRNWRRIHYRLLYHSIKYDQADFRLGEELTQLLIFAGLISGSNKDLTSQGFQFILNSYDHQLNYILSRYVDYLSRKGFSESRVIGYICTFSLLDPTQEYTYDGVEDPTLERIVLEFADIGLLSRSPSGGRRFYISPFLSHFIYERSSGKIEINLRILVETNFKMYAETSGSTDDNFTTVLFGEFAQILYKVNQTFFVCTLTRDSCRKAFEKKITGKQIVLFLNSYVHPTLRDKKVEASKVKYSLHDDSESVSKMLLAANPLLIADDNHIPENIVQQILLWEEEFHLFPRR